MSYTFAVPLQGTQNTGIASDNLLELETTRAKGSEGNRKTHSCSILLRRSAQGQRDELAIVPASGKSEGSCKTEQRHNRQIPGLRIQWNKR